MRNVGVLFLGVGLSLLAAAGSAPADVASDSAAAILVWPDVAAYSIPGTIESDTQIQVSNTSTEPVLLLCFYENANSHCRNTGEVCFESDDCFDGERFSTCDRGWTETDFRVRLTPRQPLGWLASEGLGTFPLTGAPLSVGPDGSSNAGSRVPPLPESPFTGALRCIAINNDGTPSDRNVLVGHQTQTTNFEDEVVVAKANAIGIQAIPGAVNDDRELVLGGPEAEYNGCANFIIVNHFFDRVVNPVTGFPTASILTLLPCTNDYLRQIPGEAVVQFIVYNEFEQRFSTSRSVDCKFQSFLSFIDTVDSQRSIFSAGVAGTVTGQSRLNPLGQGMLAYMTEIGGVGNNAQFNVHYQGDRAEPDLLTVP